MYDPNVFIQYEQIGGYYTEDGQFIVFEEYDLTNVEEEKENVKE